NILDFGEKAILAIVFAESDRPEYGDTIRIELISGSGPALTLEVKIPQILSEVIVMG
ncbi:flagellin, partial [candidate division KSB1 bacterium]|nr:flagellin [candidate division KSB1 bacterium]